MRITIVNGQNHKGSTYHIGKLLAEQLTEQDKIEEVFVPRDMPKFCCGCTKCFMEDEKLCPHYEYLKPITEKIDKADILIFTTPVYVYHATGSMKALLDHYGYRWIVHRPEEKMFQKQAVCISTAAGGGMRSACKDIKDSLSFWGIPKIYCYGIAVRAVSWNEVNEGKKREILEDMIKLANKIKYNQNKQKTSLKVKFYFYLTKQLHKKGWNQVDIGYWEKKGWLEKNKPWKKV